MAIVELVSADEAWQVVTLMVSAVNRSLEFATT